MLHQPDLGKAALVAAAKIPMGVLHRNGFINSVLGEQKMIARDVDISSNWHLCVCLESNLRKLPDNGSPIRRTSNLNLSLDSFFVRVLHEAPSGSAFD